jgi:hypothetical protein
MLVRRQQARARLEAEAAAAQQDQDAARQDKAARLEARAQRHQARAAALEAAADARVAGYQRRAAAKAAAGSAKRPDGRVPVAAADSAAVSRARQAAAKAERGRAAALAAPAAGGPATPLKANATDPGSRVMPGKHGGFLQGYNPQVIATRRQVIVSIATHDSPADTRALHPALAAARANLDAAGIRDPIKTALFDAGYASDDNFTAPCEAELYVAVTREARQTGRLRDGRQPQTMKKSWQQMAARLDTPDGKALYKQRSAIIEPVFAQLFARLGRHLNYRGDMVTTELTLWAATHNFLKAIRARRHAPTTARPATLAS